MSIMNYLVTESDTGKAIMGAVVWCTYDAAGLEVGTAAVTNDGGVAQISTTPGLSLFAWVNKPGYDFTNPNAITTPADGGSVIGTRGIASQSPIPVGVTVLNLITRALRLLDVVGMSEVPDDDIAADALQTLNDMIESWRVDDHMVFNIRRQLFTIQAGKQDYTIGPGGDWDVLRPVTIDRAGLIINGGDYPIELPMEILTTQRWAGITVKPVPSTLPRGIYYQPANPLGIASLWPLPSAGGNQVALYLWDELTGFNDLTQEITLPPGYMRALRYNLAIELNADYRKQLDPSVQLIAAQSKAAIERLNQPIYELTVDPALLYAPKGWNWRTGDWYR